MTWSFPCQSLSLAGKRAGMDEGSGSESSLGYEVLRILDEMKIINQLPTILVMENVPQFASKTNRTNIIKIQDRLGKLGYKSYIDVQSATDFGVPQTRKRCFMISILGDYSYQFPIPFPLKKKLKDVLEQNVPEKYYLSDKMVKYVLASGTKNYHPQPGIDPEIGRTVNTSPASHRSGVDNYITDDAKKDGVVPIDAYNHKPTDVPGTIGAGYESINHGPVVGEVIEVGNLNGHQSGRVFSEDGAAPVVMAHTHGNTREAVAVGVHAVTNGHGKLKKDDDQHKIVLEDNGQEASYSLTTANNLSGLVGISDDGKKEKAEEGLPIRDATSKGFAIAHDGDGVYIQNMTNKRGTVQKGKVPTIKAGGQDVGVVVKGIDKSANNPKEIEVANCITAREDRGVSKHEGEGTAVLEIGSYTPSGISGKVVDPKGVAPTLTTGSHGNQTGVVEPKLKQIGNIYPDRENFKNPTSGRVYDKEGVSPTINTMDGGDRQPMVAIGMAQRTRGHGRLPKGDEHRQQEIESNGGEVSNSITTVQKDSLVAEVLTKERTELGKKKRKEYENHETDLKRSDVSKLVPRKDGCSNTLTTVTKDNLIAEKKPICLNPKGGRGGVEGLQPSVENRVYSSEGTATAATTSFLPNYMDLTLRIRKLTSRECFRLQDVLDSDYDKIKDLFPESILYHLAGDSICVANLYFIFKMMFTESWTSSAH